MNAIIVMGFLLGAVMLLSGIWMRSWLSFFILWMCFMAWFGGLLFEPLTRAGLVEAIFCALFLLLASIYFFALLLGNFFLKRSILSGWVTRQEAEDFFAAGKGLAYESKLYSCLWVIVYTYSPACLIAGAIYGALN
ncbi:MAG TPA: hypothetical protein VF050_12880 [Moraxellaceae bacterium]